MVQSALDGANPARRHHCPIATTTAHRRPAQSHQMLHYAVARALSPESAAVAAQDPCPAGGNETALRYPPDVLTRPVITAQLSSPPEIPARMNRHRSECPSLPSSPESSQHPSAESTAPASRPDHNAE